MILRACLLLIFASSSVAHAAERNLWGGLGHVDQGFVLGDITGLSEELGDAAPGVGLSLGGGGGALLGGVVMVVGEGHVVHGLNGVSADRTAAGIVGGGSLGVGATVLNNGADLLYPYVGVAVQGVEVFADGNAGRAHLASGGIALDLGVSVFRLFWPEGGGMAVGGTMGAWIPVAAGEWTVESGPSPGALSGGPGGLYFRMHVGGGGATR